MPGQTESPSVASTGFASLNRPIAAWPITLVWGTGLALTEPHGAGFEIDVAPAGVFELAAAFLRLVTQEFGAAVTGQREEAQGQQR